MSNRTDFDEVARELVEMFGLNSDAGDAVTGRLVERLEAELHNAFVAGQETPALAPVPCRCSDLRRRLCGECGVRWCETCGRVVPREAHGQPVRLGRCEPCDEKLNESVAAANRSRLMI